MAPPAGHIRPARYLLVFLAVLMALYALVFFTGDREPKPKLGIDLSGGTRVTLTARTENGKPPTDEALEQAKQIIETRVNGLGVSGAEVLLDGNNIVITVPGDQGQDAKTLGQTAKLTFRKVITGAAAGKPQRPPDTSGSTAEQITKAKKTRQSENPATQQKALAALQCGPNVADPLAGNDDPHKPLVTCGKDGNKYLLGPVSPANDPNCQNTPDYSTYTCLTGQSISDASAGQAQNRPGFVVNLTFKDGDSGASRWADFTGRNVGKQAAFVLDSKVVSAPSINQAIAGGNTEISGDFTQPEAQDLSNILKYGSLPLSFQSSDAQTVSATLGIASLEAGLLAGGLGLALVVLYCLVYYRVLGMLIVGSLILSGALVFSVLVLLGRSIGFSLDLAGVAGFIVSIGITADSFVVLFERLKDEMREGRSFRSAVPRAWIRARRTILSADAVSFLAAVVLYIFAVGDVQGFAFTLGMSTVLDLVVVFLVTHPLLVYASRSKTLSRPSLSGLGSVQRTYPARRTAAAKGVS